MSRVSNSTGGTNAKVAVGAKPSSSVKGAIRQLVAQLNSAGSPSPRQAAPELDPKGVLVDTEVDGVRCVLVRVSRKAPARFSLSPREQEIARMVAKGYPNKMIASVLDISSWTVGTYLRRMFAKASVCSRAALVASFVESGHLGGIPEPAPPPQRAGPWEAGANRRRNELVTAAPLAKSKLPRR